MAKQLVVCCDGTWNVPDELRNGVAAPTDVAKLALGVATGEGSGQLLFYEPGVGTSADEHLLGGAFGYGLSQNIPQQLCACIERGRGSCPQPSSTPDGRPRAPRSALGRPRSGARRAHQREQRFQIRVAHGRDRGGARRLARWAHGRDGMACGRQGIRSPRTRGHKRRSEASSEAAPYCGVGC